MRRGSRRLAGEGGITWPRLQRPIGGEERGGEPPTLGHVTARANGQAREAPLPEAWCHVTRLSAAPRPLPLSLSSPARRCHVRGAGARRAPFRPLDVRRAPAGQAPNGRNGPNGRNSSSSGEGRLPWRGGTLEAAGPQGACRVTSRGPGEERLGR